MQKRIMALKKSADTLILAHYYQTLDVQEIADHVCDSFEMAERAGRAEERIIVICGVRFMAEGAKILNPAKTVLLPVPDAGCPMADMIEADDVLALRERHPDAAVVCYVNSSAEVKATSDICCTSSTAERIVRALPHRRIIFIPDRNLGHYIASRIPEKEVILYDGYCPPHDRITEQDVLCAKRAHPSAEILVHPECREEVLRHANFIGSTSGIIRHAMQSRAEELLIGTEMGVAERLSQELPAKRVYSLANGFVCPNMKKIRLADVLRCLETGEYEINLSEKEIADARESLERMIRCAR